MFIFVITNQQSKKNILFLLVLSEFKQPRRRIMSTNQRIKKISLIMRYILGNSKRFRDRESALLLDNKINIFLQFIYFGVDWIILKKVKWDSNCLFI